LLLKLRPYISLLRPQQYLKNGLIFFPAFFALRITEGPLLLHTSLAFLAFCLIASGVYIFNDWADREEDRRHPVKRLRPLAAGSLPAAHALALMALLWLVGLLLFALLSSHGLLLALAYIGLNLAYSLFLKKMAIIDLTIIALGFVLRIAVGAAIGQIPLSMWIILMTFLGALFLGLAKRRDDVLLASEGNQVRQAIQGYNLPFINGAMMVMASVLIVSYISYTISPEVIHRFGSQYLYLTVFFVLLGILRYMQITLVEQQSGHPTQVLLHDRFLQLTILGWLLTFVVLIY